jgi:hypothetical protein
VTAATTPLLTIDQRKTLAAVLRRRRMLQLDIRRARRAVIAAEKYLAAVRGQLQAMPTDRELEKRYGVSNSSLRRSSRNYQTLNPLDRQATDQVAAQ